MYFNHINIISNPANNINNKLQSMLMDFSFGIIFGLAAMLGFGLHTAISQAPIKSIGPMKAIFFRNIFTSFILLLALMLLPHENVFSVEYILIALAISFVGYIPLLTFYKALDSGKVGIVTPVANSSVIFTIMFSIIFFKESLNEVQLFSIALIVAGIMLISLDLKDLKHSDLFKVSSGVPYALITCVLWGLVFFLFKFPVTALGPTLTAFITEAGILVFAGANIAVSGGSFAVPDSKTMKKIAIASFFGALGSLAYNYGITVSDVSIIATLNFANPLVATIYAKAVYKEKLGIQQYAAAAMMIPGIVFISYLG